MESIFRLLGHELNLVQGDHTEPKLLTSINYHRRDLATALETAKWQVILHFLEFEFFVFVFICIISKLIVNVYYQLEDFERAVSLSAVTDKSQIREDVISRYRQFIRAIREQIIHVEESLEETSMGYPMRNAEWINLNEEDRDGLALFLSGGSLEKSSSPNELEDSGILRRFLDPTTASSSQDNTWHNFEVKSIELENMNMNSSQLGFEARDTLLGTSCNGYGEDGNWDLEVNQAKPKHGFHDNKLRRFCSRNSIFGFFNNLWTAYESPFTRNYTKRLKDGEEQSHSTTGSDVINDAQVKNCRC